jgi:uncharacterized protein with PIN domain
VNPEIKFVADVMVGKLARWLRILGFDAAYSNKYEDDELLRIAQSERRILLTRDTGLAGRCGSIRHLFIESENSREQVRQVLKILKLTEFKLFSRCLQCNTPLNDVDKEDVFEKVPPFVYLTQDRFASCPSCHRVYWHGTHAQEMLKRIP